METNNLKDINITLTDDKISIFEKYTRIFLETNSKLNLISKNDEKVLFEKHIYDSLALNLFLTPKKNESLLDIGTGGGFPAVPLAIYYENLNITALDSIRKKINAVENIKQNLNLVNLTTICTRVENFDKNFDYVTSRAVASLDKILEYGMAKLKKGGYFIAYKSKKYEEELLTAKKTISKYKLKPPKIITYKLPLEEVYERNLIIFQKPF